MIKNKFFKILVLYAGWVLYAFSQASVQEKINVYPDSAMRNYFIFLFVEAVILIFFIPQIFPLRPSENQIDCSDGLRPLQTPIFGTVQSCSSAESEDISLR